MAFYRDKQRVIDYPPEKLRDFHSFRYEWIDNLNFTLTPEECLDDPAPYISIAREMFLEVGWEGDGKIELMWVPPFALKAGNPMGVTIWHVKQQEDGTSWLLSPIPLEFAL
ncbi:hypothetical protein ACQKLP_10380 [Chitinophaga sp. NPDC101104]|uniref:hypothetical protein n=1 Tax=Chitinophaga sp. NPDC101104 TaxID=3390561 RepID=UPI003D07BFBE